MSRFYQYINEEMKDVDSESMEQFKKECYPALKDIKKNGYKFFYSGRKNNDMIIRKKVRKDRKPRDTPDTIHKLVDKAFYKKFKVKPRSGSVFTKLEYDVSFYGTPYYLFPVGEKYMYIWSDSVIDLYDYIAKELKSKVGLPQDRSMTVIWDSLEMNDFFYVDMEYPLQRRHPVLSKPKHSNYKKYTIRKFMKLTKKVANDVVSLYETSKSIKNIIGASGAEVMVYTDYVYLINSKKINSDEMKKWIYNNI